METKDEMLKNFGNRIKMLRKERGMTMEQLAFASGYTNRSSIATIEAGKRDISNSKVIAIAKALDVSPYYLIFGEEEEKEEKPNIETSTTQYMLSSKEAELLDEFRALSVPEQNMILRILKAKED